MPCPLCNSLQGVGPLLTKKEYLQTPKLSTRTFKHKNIPRTDFISSAETCYCCRILLTGVNGYLQQRERDFNQVAQVSFRFFYYSWDGQVKDCIKEIECIFIDETEIVIEFFMLEDDDCPCPDAWEDIPITARTSPGTRSKGAFQKTREWLRYCDDKYHGDEVPEGEDPEQHVSYCAASRLVSPSLAALPTRVVDVGRHDGKIKVIQGAGKADRYMCLSHCWGSQQIITTTKATLGERMREIDANELSATFSDAIWMTRRLGIDYIWIDSLCIVQDDTTDWELESVQMASIYHNAYLTLAATKSSSGAGGLFTTTPDFEVSGTTPAGEDYYLVFRETIDHESSFNTNNASRFPLMTRAWYRVLGPTEEVPLLNLRKMYSSALESVVPLRSGKLSNRVWVKLKRYFIGRMWRSLVIAYTGLNLTVASDRLPAISGVARVFAEKTRSPYLAGLFKDTLLDDLLWVTYNCKKSRLVEWRAPSWSWASIDTHIEYRDGLVYYHDDIHLDTQEERIEFATIDHSECVPAGLDEFGRVKSASLRLTSQLLPVTLLLSPDLGTFQRPVYSVRVGEGDVAPRIWPDYDLSCAGPYQVLLGAEVFCLRMIEEIESKVSMSLIVRAVPNETGEIFERIGLLQINPKTPSLDCLKPEARDSVVEALNRAQVSTVELI